MGLDLVFTLNVDFPYLMTGWRVYIDPELIEDQKNLDQLERLSREVRADVNGITEAYPHVTDRFRIRSE